MARPNTALPKQFIIARRGGPKKACSPTSSRHWWPRPERRTASPSTARLARLIGAPEAGVKRGGTDRGIGNSRGGRNSKVQAVTDQKGRPVVLVLTAGQVSDFVPAQECLEAAPKAAAVIADRGYDSDERRDFIKERGATPVIPPKKNRRIQYRYDKALYKTRHCVERFFCRLKDFRRVATRYDRQPYIFMAAVFLVSIVAFWL